MPPLQHWTVYNKTTGRVDIAKSKKYAIRIAITYNKLFKLLDNNENVIYFSTDEFFENHHVDKENIYFTWNIKSIEKMILLKKFFNKRLYSKI